MKTGAIEKAYRLARERYAELGVDTEAALRRLRQVPISMHCWQGDDVAGFEKGAGILDGGLAVTGRYPGKARNADELRQDAETALRCVPGRHRFNLHAIYAETSGRRVDRDALEPRHFARWIDWARQRGLGLDFNPTFFSHPKAADGLTLTHPDPGIRRFWIAHGQACRRVGAAMGRALGSPCVVNVWIPDGSKDVPADRLGPRQRLLESLDALFETPFSRRHLLDSVEGKLFGIGTESYVAGSHEFYLGYAVRKRILLCLDTGHFHPTETVRDKLSAILLYLDGLLLHVSRGIRWDSDHVVVFDDELRGLAEELVRGRFLDRVHLGLDYFDATINRVAAWVLGMRATQQALLAAMLEPTKLLQQRERAGDLTARLAYAEAAKTLPFSAVWDYYCLQQDVPVGAAWLPEIQRYERTVLSQR